MLKKFFKQLQQSRRDHPVLFWVRVLVVALVGGLLVIGRNFWTPDTLFVLLLVIAVVFGQVRSFVTRFLPFVLLLLVYDSFRSIADDLNTAVHYTEMIQFDRVVFGGVLPTTVLQTWWWHGSLQWYDFYFYLLYTLHFVAPLVMAVLIWRLRDSQYWPYVTSLVVLSFAGFITYVIFPAAPPWLASDNGYIEPIYRISSDIWSAMGVTNFSEVYNNLSPNPVAAVPSLHAAYPVLLVLYAAKLFGWRRMWWLVLYPLSVWTGVVYLGEHYMIDVLLGLLYALAAYSLSQRVFAWKRQRNIHIRSRLAAWGKRVRSAVWAD